MKLTDAVNAVDTKQPSLFFIDRQGNIDRVSLCPDRFEGTAVEDIHITLLEAAGCGRPCFPICTVVNGVLQDRSGDTIETEDLPALLKDAEDERIRFYSERAKEYGESAWPSPQPRY
jgi:hypothetical protein